MKKRVIILLTLIIVMFLMVLKSNIIMKNLETSSNNTVRKINTNNYAYKLDLKISYKLYKKNITSNILYGESSNGNVKKYVTETKDNNTTTNIFENYLIKENNELKYYSNNGKWEFEIIKNADKKKIFNLNYSDLFTNLRNIKKIDEDKTYEFYSAKIEKYKAYNFIYKNDILKKEDISGTTNVKIVIDKNDNLIKEISYKIENIKKDSIKATYELKLNNDFNTNNIKLPF